MCIFYAQTRFLNTTLDFIQSNIPITCGCGLICLGKPTIVNFIMLYMPCEHLDSFSGWMSIMSLVWRWKIGINQYYNIAYTYVQYVTIRISFIDTFSVISNKIIRSMGSIESKTSRGIEAQFIWISQFSHENSYVSCCWKFSTLLIPRKLRFQGEDLRSRMTAYVCVSILGFCWIILIQGHASMCNLLIHHYGKEQRRIQLIFFHLKQRKREQCTEPW